MSDHGILVVVSGFSGAGKGTLMNALMKKYNNYGLSISATTRRPRQNEVDGREYFFLEKTEFEAKIADNQFLEHARYVENFYGTPKDYVFKQMAAGKDVILEIEIQGALNVKQNYPQTLLLFVMPPNGEELKRRLINRGSESLTVINARLKRAAEESEGIENYDYILMNDNIDKCVDKMHQIIQAQHFKTENNITFIQQIREELKSNRKGE